MPKSHYWIQVEKNPKSKGPGQIMFNLYDVECINVIREAGAEEPVGIQIQTPTGQFNLDGCGADYFLEYWAEFQKFEHSRAYKRESPLSEKSAIEIVRELDTVVPQS